MKRPVSSCASSIPHYERLGRLGKLGPAQGNTIEEPECAYDLIETRPRNPVFHEIHLVGTHILMTEPFWRAAKKRLNFATACT